jgi:hypothetical protein
MKNFFYIFITLLFIAGCGNRAEVFTHRGLPFTETLKTVTIKELDKTYPTYVRGKQPVRIQGKIKYQCKIKGLWAFVDDGSGLLFIDFEPATPNIALPTHQYPYTITIEGRITPDETVLNNYHIIPTAYEFSRD